MKTKTENTILDQNETSNELTLLNEENTEIQNSITDSDEYKKGCAWSVVTISGIAGIMLGSASTLLATEIQDGVGSQESDNSLEDASAHAATGHHTDIVYASTVNDEMSFNEAFAAARHEVGTGGAFVWHGNVYGTFHADEWNQMTLEDQHIFTTNALGTPHQVPTYTEQEHAAMSHEVQPHTESHSTESHASASHTSTNHIPATHTTNMQATATTAPATNGSPASKPENGGEDVEIEVLGVEENVILEDGSVVNFGYAEVDGHTAIFIDGNNDIQFEQMVIDVNDNHKIDGQDIIREVDSPDLNVNSFNEALNAPLHATEDLYAQMPDYTNDANVTDFA